MLEVLTRMLVQTSQEDHILTFDDEFNQLVQSPWPCPYSGVSYR